jgi:teichuronic acid biosynthesis glycosyltransferase TuaC
MSMKVLHVTNAFPTHDNPDYGIFIHEQIASLQKHVELNDIYFINARDHGAIEYIKSICRLHKILITKNYDIIHCHHLFSFYVVFLTFAWKKTKIVVSLLNQPEYEIKLKIPKFLKKIAFKIAKIYSNKIILKNTLAKKDKSDSKIIQIPNGVDDQKFKIIARSQAKEFLGLRQESNYILFVSSKNPNRKQKRRDLFLEIVSQLKKRFPEKNFEAIEISGVSREKVRYFFNACCCHLLTSDYEGSPNSVKEALVCGVPVVSRPVGNVKEMIGENPFCKIFVEQDITHVVDFVGAMYPIADSARSNLRDVIYEKRLDMSSIAKKLMRTYIDL